MTDVNRVWRLRKRPVGLIGDDVLSKVEGFIILDYASRYPEAIGALAQWMQQGRLKFKVDMHQGLENAVSTLRMLDTGGNQGKLMLHVA